MFQKKPEVCLAPATATIRQELAQVRTSAASIRARREQARIDQAEVQRRYDADVQAAAIANRSMPDRRTLAEAINNADALARVEEAANERVRSLIAQLASSQLADEIAASGEKLPVLASAAESKLDEFRAALETARSLESELFTILFNGDDGLRQRFDTAELQTLAARARRKLATKIMDLGSQSGYRVNPRFDTDGERNLGVEDGFYVAY